MRFNNCKYTSKQLAQRFDWMAGKFEKIYDKYEKPELEFSVSCHPEKYGCGTQINTTSTGGRII